MLKCYTRIHLVRVLPQAALLAFGEVVVAVLARDRDRARAVIGAWRWNARRLTELSLLRGELAEHRLFPDAEVRRLQVRGSARLSRYLSRLSHQGLEAANAVRRPGSGPTGGRAAPRWPSSPAASGSAFSEDADFDELDDLGRRAGRDRFGRRVRPAPLEHRAPARAGHGGRAASSSPSGPASCSSGPCRWSGQLAPLPSWSTSWHHFFSGWQSAGVGTTAPASPAFGLVGLTGTVLFGAMGTLQRVLLLGCIPLGAWGVSRFMRPLVSPRARVVAVICYLGLPLPYGALGTGRWDGLVAYAAFPFIALRLARAAGVEPYAVEPGTALAEPARRARSPSSVPSSPPRRASRRPSSPWSSLTAVAWVLGSVLVGARDAGVARARGGGRGGGRGAGPGRCPGWSGRRWPGKGSVAIFGLPLSGATAPSWGEVIRFAIGPAARSPIVWLLVAARGAPAASSAGAPGWPGRRACG